MIKFILYIFVFSCLSSIAQKDNVNLHLGLQLNYTSVIYPSNSPRVLYKYSQAYGGSFFLERTSKKRPKLSFTTNFGFNILDLNEKLIDLDTFYWQRPFIYHDVTFRYNHYFLNIHLNKKISRLYSFGIGLSFNYYHLTRTSYYPKYYYYFPQCSPCLFHSYTANYTVMADGFSYPMLLLNNKFQILKNHFLGLTLIINPIIRGWSISEDNVEGGGSFYTGANIEALNFLSLNYTYYLK